MLINLRNALMVGKRKPTAKDYVQDGLIAMWDGIENAGWGEHVSSSSTWKDLVSDYPLSLSSGGFGSDYKYISDVAPVSSCYGSYSFSAPSEFTMELAISQLVINGTRGTKPLFMLFTSSGFVVGMIGIQTRDPPMLNTKASNASNHDVMDVSSLDSGCFAITLSSDGELKTYYNGTLVGARTVTTGQVHTCCITTSYRPRYSGYGCTGNWHRMSIYSRALTADEIAANYAIDKERFGLT